MKSEEFINIIRQRSQLPYVFISYSSSIKDVRERVILLGRYLEKCKINVVYDMGGLPVGINIDEFMEKIANDNCKYVLLVCDNTYYTKTKNSNTGVKIEYEYLLNRINTSSDRELELSKVFLLMAECVEDPYSIIPDTFKRRIYTNFLDAEKTTFSEIYEIVQDCKIVEEEDSLLLNNTDKELTSMSSNKYTNANTSYDRHQYNAALSDINEAIKIYQYVRNKNNWILIDYYNLAVSIHLRLYNMKEARLFCNKELDILKKYKKTRKIYKAYAICYNNLSMTYIGNDTNLHEDFAHKALINAKKACVKDLYHYNTLYAVSLFMSEKYHEAYDYQKKALSQLDDDQSVMGIKIYSNLAEICVLRSKDRTIVDKKELLHEGEDYINTALMISKRIRIDDKDILLEMYSISEKVFDALKIYYSK